MSHQFTTEQIHKRYESLPEDIKTVVSSREVAELLESIGREHKLRIDKTGLLIEQTTLIMLGFIKSHEFVNNLTRELQIGKEQAESIAIEIDEQVFSRIRKSLRDVQFESKTDSRFEEASDYGDNPTRDSLLADVEKHAQDPEKTTPASQVSMSSVDYQPGVFLGNTTPTGDDTPPSAHADTAKNYDTVPTPTTNTQEAPIAPAPPIDSENLNKDFKQRLAEKIKESPSSVSVNADPYKESID